MRGSNEGKRTRPGRKCLRLICAALSRRVAQDAGALPPGVLDPVPGSLFPVLFCVQQVIYRYAFAATLLTAIDGEAMCPFGLFSHR